MAPHTVLIVAGEPSGDLHGGALARALSEASPGVRLIGIGGAAMREAGVELLHGIESFAVLGISEVAGKLPFFLGVLRQLRRRFDHDPPDLVILIDYPDFNLRLAAAARAAGVKVLYYISPQVWAWRAGRVRQLAGSADRIAVVFPFEVDFYRERGVAVECVGHPLLERVRTTRPRGEVRRSLGVSGADRLVALLPGSRVQEVKRILPPLADAARRLADAGVAVAVSRAESIPAAVTAEILARAGVSPPVWDGTPYDLVGAADLAVVASGTATLETGLLGTPLIVVYRMAPLSWLVARRMVRVPHVGLVNLAAGKRVAPELLQGAVTGPRVAEAALAMLDDPARLESIRRELALLAGRLGGPGASARTARMAVDLLEGR